MDRSHVKVVECTNSETFVEFLKELRQECSRLVILLDNGSYHLYKTVYEFVKSTDGEIKLVCLQSHILQLNSIKIQWRALKEMFAGKHF